MTEEFIASENGSINISQEVIVRIGAISAREVEGVVGLGTSGTIGDIIEKLAPAKGVKVETIGETTSIDVHVTVTFGVKINDVALKVQCAVKNAVEEFAGLENVVVNVFVDAIETAAEKTEEKKK